MGKSVKHVIAIEEVEALLSRIRTINALPLQNIVWVRDGLPIPVTKDDLDDWKFTGLSNVTFAEMVLIESTEVEE